MAEESVTPLDQELGWPLGPLEMRILRAIWERGRATVRDVLDDVTRQRRVAYTTVMTVMGRLADKHLLRRELVGKTYYYTPALTQADLAGLVSRRVLQSLVAEFGEMAIAQFSAELDRVDPHRLHRLRSASSKEQTKP